MRFLCNILDPTKKWAKYSVRTEGDETIDEAWERYNSWLKGKIIGLPVATEYYTVQELRNSNIVGVYEPEG